MWNGSRHFAAIALAVTALVVASCTNTPPVSLIQRAIEARSTADIIDDNRIVIEVNKAMADVRSIKASTEIYEQRLLITGLFDEGATHDAFRNKVRAVKGVKKLYWHAAHMSEKEQERQKDQLLGWAEAVTLDSKIEAQLLATRGVGSVNFRVAVDAFGTVYLLGRARSGEELKKVLSIARAAKGAKRVVNYAEVRP